MAALSDRFSNTSGVGQRTYISSLSYESPGGGGAAFCLKEDKRGRVDYLTGSGPEKRINSKKGISEINNYL